MLDVVQEMTKIMVTYRSQTDGHSSAITSSMLYAGQDAVKYDANNRFLSHCIGASYSPAGLHGYPWLTRVRC
jgi:hypothetical protein